MGTLPIPDGYFYPFQIALNSGYRAYTISRLMLRRRLSWEPLWFQKALVELFTPKNFIASS